MVAVAQQLFGSSRANNRKKLIEKGQAFRLCQQGGEEQATAMALQVVSPQLQWHCNCNECSMEKRNLHCTNFFAFECESTIVKIAWNAKSAPMAMDALSASTPSESASKQLFEAE